MNLFLVTLLDVFGIENMRKRAINKCMLMGRTSSSHPWRSRVVGSRPRGDRAASNSPWRSQVAGSRLWGAGQLVAAHSGTGWLLATCYGWASPVFHVVGCLSCREPPLLLFTWAFRRTGPLLAHVIQSSLEERVWSDRFLVR